VTVVLKINGPNIPLEDTPHHTDAPGKLTACSFVTFGFSVAQYTQLCLLTVSLHLKIARSDQEMKPGNYDMFLRNVGPLSPSRTVISQKIQIFEYLLM
jgi:hypothetical protein